MEEQFYDLRVSPAVVKLPGCQYEHILTQAMGQCVLLDFPATPLNIRQFNAHNHRQLFQWALRQPGASLRVLWPGESAFMPAMQSRFIISLGHKGSNYSATALTYVAHGALCHPDLDVEMRGWLAEPAATEAKN